MAVQAHYHSNNTLFLIRDDSEAKDMDFPRGSFIDQSTILFNNEGNGNSRKRAREAVAGVPEPMMTLAQLQSHHQNSTLVSTGLRLAFEDNKQSKPLLRSTSSSISTSGFSDEFAAQINQQKQEIEQLIVSQSENLRRSLAEKRRLHLRALLIAAQQSASQRLQSKQAELELASRRRAELEDRLTRLRTESMTWQSRALAQQATAASLHARLQAAASLAQAKPDGDENGGSNQAEDAESAFVDPDRVEPARACRTCFARPATVVLLPCRHLCACVACESPVRFCPVCGAVRTGSVEVFME